MKISIISVNYNTEKCIRRLLDSLVTQTLCPSDFELILVNNSQNENLAQLCRDFKGKFKLKIIQSSENIGFGRANNLGAKNASGEYLLLINPDALIQEADYLERIYDFAQQNPQHGIISTRVIDDGLGADSGPFYTYAYGVKFALPGEIAAVIGALMFINKTVFEAVNGFDPDFFLYDEESDLCLRIRQQGYSIYQINELSVRHIGGVSEAERFKYEYWVKRQRGLYLFCYKHYSPELFNSILHKDITQARWKRFKLWLEIKVLKLRNKIVKYDRWSAIYDCARKTVKSPAWLFYGQS